MIKKLLPSLIIIVAVWASALLLSSLELLQQIELTVLDAHFRLRGQTQVDDRLALIMVDTHTVKKYGYPFSRSFYAITANALVAAGAKVVAFDLIFDQEQPQDAMGDEMLVAVTSRHENIIHAWNAFLRKAPTRFIESGMDIPSALSPLPLELELYQTAGNISLPYPHLRRACQALGLVSVIPGSDGSIRHIPLLIRHDERSYPSLALLTACRALDLTPVAPQPGDDLRLRGAEQEIKIPIDAMGQMLVNYTGDLMSVTNRFSFYDVHQSIVSGEPIVPVSTFKDKVVIVGISDLTSSDICSTPFDNLFPGIAVHAMAVDTILRRRFLIEGSRLLNAAVLLLFTIATVFVTTRFRATLAAVSTGVLLIALWLVSYLSFSYGGTILNFVQPMTGIALAFCGVLLYSYRKAQIVRNTFQKYVSHGVMREIINRGGRIPPIDHKKLTVLFSDLKDFSTWAESYGSQPEKLVEELNEFFAAMVDVIFEYNGTLLEYTGDGLFVVYGAPLESPTPALDAVRTGLEMQRRLNQLNQKRLAAGKPDLHMRIGINTGIMVIGNIGPEKRQKYGIVGDAVNVGQRTETECQPGRVAITDDTYQEVNASVIVEPLGLRYMKGKSKPVMLYYVIDEKS